jgi:hypothetical protein
LQPGDILFVEDDSLAEEELLLGSQDTTSSAFLSSQIPKNTVNSRLNVTKGAAGKFIKSLVKHNVCRNALPGAYEQNLEQRKKREEGKELGKRHDKQGIWKTSGCFVKDGEYDVNKNAPKMQQHDTETQRSKQAVEFSKIGK